MSQSLTSKEKLALDLIFGSVDEARIDWTMAEYMDVASRAGKLDVMHADVNQALGEMAAAGYAPYEICYFKAGDRSPWFEPFPTSLSKETVRKAWVKSGMRELQRKAKPTRKKLNQ